MLFCICKVLYALLYILCYFLCIWYWLILNKVCACVYEFVFKESTWFISGDFKFSTLCQWIFVLELYSFFSLLSCAVKCVYWETEFWNLEVLFFLIKFTPFFLTYGELSLAFCSVFAKICIGVNTTDVIMSSMFVPCFLDTTQLTWNKKKQFIKTDLSVLYVFSNVIVFRL